MLCFCKGWKALTRVSCYYRERRINEKNRPCFGRQAAFHNKVGINQYIFYIHSNI